MLFLSQLRREFSPSAWNAGQQLFARGRVAGVRLDGQRIAGKVTDADRAHDTIIDAVRGTIGSASCTCAMGSQSDDPRCIHVAALSVWMLKRGSLLRSGIDDASAGAVAPGTSDQKTPKKERPPESVQAVGVSLVRGIFEDGTLTAVSIEPALRYRESTKDAETIKPVSQLIQLSEEGHWRSPQGFLIRSVNRQIPVLQNLDAAPVRFTGDAALENLARLLLMKEEEPDRLAFHESVAIRYDTDPLKIYSLNIGRREEKHRELTYEFRNESVKLSSLQLEALSKAGKVSSQFVWLDDCLYKFETSLIAISRYANQRGVAEGDTPKGRARAVFAAAAVSRLEDTGEHPLHPLAAYRLSRELGVEKFTVDEDWQEFHEWRKLFEKKRLPALPSVEYGFDLRDYQTNGLTWLWSLYQRGLAALLADDMGLGKTHQTLAYLSCLYRGNNSKSQQPSLVVAPTSVVAAWSQKLQKYDTGLKWHVFHGNARTLPSTQVNLVLTTYGVLQRESLLWQKDWHVVILDEAQAIKNATTINSRVSRVLRSRFRIAMTGTPIENHATDLWSIMDFLLPGYLGTLPRFKRLYASGRDGGGNTAALKRLVAPFMLRRTKAQVLTELPEKTEEVIHCDMTLAQRKAYEQCLTSAEAEKIRRNIVGGERVDYAGVLALLTRLKQVCDHPRLPEISSGRLRSVRTLAPEETGKWEHFDELLTEALGSSLKIVVFTQYLGTIDLISHSLKQRGIGHTELRGDTIDRAARLEKFANDPDCRVFLCSLLAGGLGIDLTSASVCIHFDRWWNPAKENQATDRLHRIGQTRGVQVFKLQIRDSIEDRIARIIQSKLELSGALIEESPTGLKAFSREELLDLLSMPN